MYNMLYDAWLKEKINADLQKLPKDFYARLADYIRRIHREGRMLDAKSAKALLTCKELENVTRLTKELAMMRFKKIVSCIASGKTLGNEALSLEEERILHGLRTIFEEFQSFLKNELRGKTAKIDEFKPAKKMVLRFVKEFPTIIGVDLKVYGPFLVEDVATMPAENAKVLVEQGVAMEIETR
ncbi:MAG: hypothetical protein ACLFU9_05020 [Candidatus Bathyarchaeia archaeon]